MEKKIVGRGNYNQQRLADIKEIVHDMKVGEQRIYPVDSISAFRNTLRNYLRKHKLYNTVSFNTKELQKSIAVTRVA